MLPEEAMRRIDALLSHVWMVRTFVKHSEEAADDEELMDIVRALYDYNLAVGAAWREQDAPEYLKAAKKKFTRLRKAADDFAALQPQVSDHTNYQMAVASLKTAVAEIALVLDAVASRAG